MPNPIDVTGLIPVTALGSKSVFDPLRSLAVAAMNSPMQSLLPLLLLLEAAAMPPSPIDPQRVEAELAADADVLRSLNENGDVPSIVRPVDVRFIGQTDSVRSLEEQIGSLGWRVVQRVQLDDGSEALDVQRDQRTDATAIRQLTEAALEIEGRYGVRYDGWGTVATKR